RADQPVPVDGVRLRHRRRLRVRPARCDAQASAAGPRARTGLVASPPVSTRNRNKRIQNRQSRLTAFEVGQRRARRRRWAVATGGLVLALVIAIAFGVRSGGGDKKNEKKTTAKPCVAVRDTLPKGAPNVPVKVGPPPSRLVKEDLKVGSGAVVKPGATVTVNYIGVSCSTGKIFDSSYKTGSPATFPLGGVI